jgi:hypothetical protein
MLRVCKAGEGAGFRHFSRRMNAYPEVFERATGERLVPGTLNLNVGVPTPVTEHLGEPNPYRLTREACCFRTR